MVTIGTAAPLKVLHHYYYKFVEVKYFLQVLDDWNKGELESFLIEITRDIMSYKDTDGAPLVEKIRDTAGQKGTGKWTAISSLEYGVPVTLIGQ